MTTNNNRIDRIEDAIIRLTENHDQLTETQQQLGRNLAYIAETQRMMSENITLLTQAQIESKQRHEETDQRFNILLQEIRHLSGRIDDFEEQ